MKKTFLLSTIFTLLAFLMIGTTSCSKFKKNPADLIVGDYIGSGTDANENPYISQIIRVTKISNKRVKVEPVGHSYITAFEIDVKGFKRANKVASTDEVTESLAAEIGEATVTLAFTGTQEETFGGTKQ